MESVDESQQAVVLNMSLWICGGFSKYILNKSISHTADT